MWNVSLYEIERPILVVESATGVVYTNQVGGEVCFQASIEGFLLPLGLSDRTVLGLENLPFRQGTQGLSVELADAMDSLLKDDPLGRAIAVDRSRLSSSWEAWVFVHASFDGDRAVAKYEGPSRMTSAVLTWQNSD